MNTRNPSIFVDADSCPVKEEIIQIAGELHVPVIFVSSYSHRVEDERVFQSVIVDNEKEAADLYIMNHVKSEDVVVTQDHALASLLLPKKAEVISPRGIRYTEKNIPMMLQTRYISQKQRRAGNRTRGPKKFSDQDRTNFCENFRKIFEKKEGI